MPIAPHGQRRARTAVRGKHATVYKSREQLSEEETFRALMYEHRPEHPLAGPLELAVSAWFPIPESKPKKWKKKAKLQQIAHTKKPDLDNVVKHLTDCMMGVFFVDDKQIARVIAEKGYAEHPHYDIVLRTLELEE